MHFTLWSVPTIHSSSLECTGLNLEQSAFSCPFFSQCMWHGFDTVCKSWATVSAANKTTICTDLIPNWESRARRGLSCNVNSSRGWSCKTAPPFEVSSCLIPCHFLCVKVGTSSMSGPWLMCEFQVRILSRSWFEPVSTGNAMTIKKTYHWPPFPQSSLRLFLSSHFEILCTFLLFAPVCD